MQNQYVGDIGDFMKYALLRAVHKAEPDRQLGVAWYLNPNSGGTDGRYIQYLMQPKKWRSLDAHLFDELDHLVNVQKTRTVQAVQYAPILPRETIFLTSQVPRKDHRRHWFHSCEGAMKKADIIFADPDNGLTEKSVSKKHVCLDEASRLATDKIGIFYHHNTRSRGKHGMEITFWRNRLIQTCGAKNCRAVYWRPHSPRSFFIVNSTQNIDAALMGLQRAGMKCRDGSNAVQLYGF